MCRCFCYINIVDSVWIQIVLSDAKVFKFVQIFRLVILKLTYLLYDSDEVNFISGQ